MTAMSESRSLPLQALDRMILSVEEDLRKETPNTTTEAFLQGELKGYRNARTYIEECDKRSEIGDKT